MSLIKGTETPSVASGPGEPSGASHRLVVESLSRSFGETRALNAAELKLRPGEIHSLAGENGSGKSTLIKILSGVIRQDSGQLLWDGEPASFSNPRASQIKGISTVFQETLVTPELSVKDNIYFGTDGLFRRGHRRSEEVAGAHAALRELGLDKINLNRPAWSLSLAERQLVTIARAIVRPWKVLILDEGTSALDSSQRDRLFEYLRVARGEGRSILFTSHRMDEVFELADRITVLRVGATIATLEVGETNQREVLDLMSGKQASERITAAPATSAPSTRARTDGEVVLRVNEVVLRANAEPVKLALESGRILGVAGLEGQGQVEFVECLCALRKPVSGHVVAVDANGGEQTLRNYRDANRHGVRYVPRDRRHEGLFAPLSVFENFAIALWSDLNRFGVLRRKEARRRYRDYSQSSRLVTGSASQTIATLSGGNQQKILLGRWIAMEPKVLVLNDPLRGVDANTKEELYAYFRAIADTGVAIVFLSTEIIELLTLTDQIAVFHEGKVQALLSADSSTDTDIVAAMFGEDEKAS